MRNLILLKRMWTLLKFSEHNPFFFEANSTANGTASDDTVNHRWLFSTVSDHCERTRCLMLQRGRMNYVVEAEALNLFVDMKN